MKVIGLTGGIGSGKSTVAFLLKEKYGAYVILTDDVARKLMKKGQVPYEKIVNHFGKDILKQDGEIDRSALAKIVFQNEKEKNLLNSFTHPYVKEYVLAEIAHIRTEKTYSMVIVETALLKEAGYKTFCDEVWVVNASKEVRRKRLMETRGYTEEKIESIIKNQLREDEFEAIATVMINNSGTIEELERQIQQILRVYENNDTME